LINGNGITFSSSDPPLITTTNGTLTSFVIKVAMTIEKFPIVPGGAFTVSLALFTASNPQTGTITGQVNVNTNAGTPPAGKVRKLSVAAQTIGTNTVVSSARISPGGMHCPPAPGGCFTLILPAAGPQPASQSAPPFGTLYDLAVSGGAATYGALRLPPLFPSGLIQMTNFAVTGNQMLGNITGTVGDGCIASKPIVGATLQLLTPPDNIVKPAANFCMPTADNPTANLQCISVATAITDNIGGFPQPGTLTTPTAFANVPILAKGANPYVMEVTAAGYNPLFVQALPGNGTNKKGGGTCSVDGGPFKACNLHLMTGYIAGAFPIVPPNPGQTATVVVFAEDHGTNNIESTLPTGITVTSNQKVGGCSPPPPEGSVCANFKLNVPAMMPTFPVDAFDLFASTSDNYQGVSDPYQGHSIVAISDVPAPAACATVTINTPTNPNQVISCVGHGSIIGTVGNPNLGASVVLEKLDPDPPMMDDNDEVQITSSIIQNQPEPGNTPTSNYGFCAPADTYTVQEFQLPKPVSSVVPAAIPSPSAVPSGAATVTIPPPPSAGGSSPTPTPAIKCPTNCSHPDGTCPGICNIASPEPELPPLPTPLPASTMTPTATPTL
jgi:hypothetical protein